MPVINPELDIITALDKKAEEIRSQRDKEIDKIHSGFVDRAILFIDMVDSTAFKMQNMDKPEIWILRLKVFFELLTNVIEHSNGKVIKYIGDEVMASFENIKDASNIIQRKDEIIANLMKGTGIETFIKISADFGEVYEFIFSEHSKPDPQGIIVDRCARISKFNQPNEVLASSSFAKKTTTLNWKKVGSVELKGLEGLQQIYQLEHATVSLNKFVEIDEKDLTALKDKINLLETELSRVKEQNIQLNAQIKSLGEKPNISIYDNDDNWENIENEIKTLKQLIDEACSNSRQYAKFIFLHYSGKGYEEYNKAEGKTFDDLIISDLVISEDNKYFELNLQNRRNLRIIDVLHEIDKQLHIYLDTHEQNAGDLFDWSLSDAEFWKEYIGYNVKY